MEIQFPPVFRTNVDQELFAVKTFSDSMASPKIKPTKIMHIINDSVVRGHLSENI